MTALEKTLNKSASLFDKLVEVTLCRVFRNASWFYLVQWYLNKKAPTTWAVLWALLLCLSLLMDPGMDDRSFDYKILWTKWKWRNLIFLPIKGVLLYIFVSTGMIILTFPINLTPKLFGVMLVALLINILIDMIFFYLLCEVAQDQDRLGQFLSSLRLNFGGIITN